MAALKTFREYWIWLLFIPFTWSYSPTVAPGIVLQGSTPGDDMIRKMLAIPADIPVDFIKWQLTLEANHTFQLSIHYGESKPNTLGFIQDGFKQTLRGTYTINPVNAFREVYQLSGENAPSAFSLVKLNENLFHLLSQENELMVGNGGWSYSLNRKNPAEAEEILLISKVSDEVSSQLIYDGRTPCVEIAAEHPEMNVSSSCFKLKWRLILYKDSVSHLPTGFTIRKVIDNQPRMESGTWEIIKGTKSNPQAVLYKLNFSKPEESMTFLAGDDNVLFFLSKNETSYIGNADFSFALNRKLPD